jgi:hypothetical protein
MTTQMTVSRVGRASACQMPSKIPATWLESLCQVIISLMVVWNGSLSDGHLR